MEEDLTWGADGRSHLGHGSVGSYGDRSRQGKAGTSQGEDLCGRMDHAAEYSFCSADKGLDHQSLDSRTSFRIGQEEAHASDSHRSHVGEEAREGSLVEGLRVYGNLWRVAAADSRSTYHVGEYSFGGNRLPCMMGSPLVVGNPWRAGSYRSRGHHCDDFHDASFLRG